MTSWLLRDDQLRVQDLPREIGWILRKFDVKRVYRDLDETRFFVVVKELSGEQLSTLSEEAVFDRAIDADGKKVLIFKNMSRPYIEEMRFKNLDLRYLL